MKKESNIWDNYNNLLLSEDISRIRKILSRYELFKNHKYPGRYCRVRSF